MRGRTVWLVLGLAAAAVLCAGDSLAAVAAEAADAPGLWDRLVAYVRGQQQALHRELAGAVRAIREDGSPATVWSLVTLSFLYGVFHAAGPGHGKAVITTYLLTQEDAIKRGLLLSVAAAMVQGLTAIVLVLGLVAVIGWTRQEAQASVGTLETVSFALIALLGGWLAWRALRGLWRRCFARAQTAEACDHCGHAHHVGPEQAARAKGLLPALGIVLSVGLRPCSGGVLVLLFAQVLGLIWAGVAAVFAMSVGTAITVSALALLALSSRQAASRFAHLNGARFAIAGQMVALAGGLVILALGLSLLAGSMGGEHPLFRTA